MSKLYIDESSYDDIQAILFDKDGTIIDFMVWVHWLEAFLNFLDSVVSVPYHKSFVRKSLGVSANYRSWDSTGAFAMGTSQDLFTIVSLAFYQQGLPFGASLSNCSGNTSKVRNDICLRPLHGTGERFTYLFA